MMRVACHLFVLLVGLECFSQSTFNLIYDNGKRTELSFFAQEIDSTNTYLVTSTSFGNSLDELQIHKIAYDGYILDTLRLRVPDKHWYPENIITTLDNHYLAAGTLWDGTTSSGEFFLLKFDILLDTLWFHTYSFFQTLEGTKKVKPTVDGGYVVAGFTYDYDKEDGQNLIFKVDSAGNKEWEFIHGDGTHNEEPYDVIQLADSNLLVLSRRVRGLNDNIVWLKLSPDGQLIWEKEITSQHSTIGSVIIPVDESILLVAGQGKTQPFVQCFDTAGHPLWIKYYATIYGTFWHGDKVNDSTYVFAGAIRPVFGDSDGYLVKTDENGDTIWKRTISPIGKENNPSNDYFYGVLTTSDGGILCTGFTGKGPISNTQDAWIMKLDSNGLCDTATCFPWLVSVIPNPEPAMIKVWPNPSTAYVNILLPKPVGTLNLYNLAGQQVLAKEVRSSREQLPVSRLSEGIYLLNWVEDGVVLGNRKVVIQR